jgi:hypothetical protein
MEDAAARKARLKALRAAADDDAAGGGAGGGNEATTTNPNDATATTKKPLINPLAAPDLPHPDGSKSKSRGFYSDPMAQYEDPQVAGRVLKTAPSGGGGAGGLMPGLGGRVGTFHRVILQ